VRLTNLADWRHQAGLDDICHEAVARSLAALAPQRLPAGAVLFRPGDPVDGFVVVLEGRIEVHLTGPSGREILLYGVSPGETCVQTTLGLLGEDDYSGEAVAASDLAIVIIPRALFERLIATSARFRTFVFQAFANRLQLVMRVLERVAFVGIEARLADALVERADGSGRVEATHHELAVAIGTAREVVTRRLQAFEKKGWVRLERGALSIIDRAAIVRLLAA
jgi:CRP/FNR family transcriptional regulator